MRPGEILRSHGLKKTYPRTVILELFEEKDQFLSAEDIAQVFLDAGHPVPLSTIYRILDQLTEKQLLSEVHLDTSQVKLYERAHTHHAHHLICTACEKVIHIDSCPVHDFEATLTENHHFQVTHHTLNFYGLCEACQKVQT